MFWLSYECFSILCNAFLLKSAISSNNSCDTTTYYRGLTIHVYITVVFAWFSHNPIQTCVIRKETVPGDSVSYCSV